MSFFFFIVLKLNSVIIITAESNVSIVWKLTIDILFSEDTIAVSIVPITT